MTEPTGATFELTGYATIISGRPQDPNNKAVKPWANLILTGKMVAVEVAVRSCIRCNLVRFTAGRIEPEYDDNKWNMRDTATLCDKVQTHQNRT